jgi:hypothetical protein
MKPLYIKTMSGKGSLLRRGLTAMMAAGLLGTAALAHAAPGAIWTSLKDGDAVNANLYTAKCGDLGVWLNGGPNNSSGGAGLPEGTYVFQVTDPSGASLLSSDVAGNRQVVVTGGYITGVTGGDGGYTPHAVSDVPGPGTAVELCPFDNTPNPGGEYKVWLTPLADFTGVGECSLDYTQEQLQSDLCKGNFGFVGGHIKTDNFKAPDDVPECTPGENCFCDLNPTDPVCCELHSETEGCGGGNQLPFEISGVKFYDANANGEFDQGEVGIPSWLIELYGDSFDLTYTEEDGGYLFEIEDSGEYGVCEVFPDSTSVWKPTTDQYISGIQINEDTPTSTDNNFGNLCLGAGGGHTLGFWSNKNGYNIMNDDNDKWPNELTSLSELPLRDAAGIDVSFADYTAFRTWLLNAKATNMAYMLSAQYAAMWLNVEASSNHDGFVAPNAIIYAGNAPADCDVNGLGADGGLADGYITIGNLMEAAITQLSDHPVTVSAGAERSCQEFLKNALDDANNNKNFVQSESCDFTYPEHISHCFDDIPSE